MTFNNDDKTLNDLLNDLLSSLHSTKVRRMHTHTDEQLNFIYKHNEFNRMIQAYVDVFIHNRKASRIFLIDIYFYNFSFS